VPSSAPARAAFDRQALVGWYRRNRDRSRRLFDLIEPAAYYSRPIALRNPIVFYEGHLPAFSIIALLKRGLGRPGVDERMERLFERGIDPDSADSAVPRSGAGTVWPARDEVLAFGRRADDAIIDALSGAEFDIEGAEHVAMRRGEAIFTALEHEAMHQETLLYMWRRLPYSQKRRPADLPYETGSAPIEQRTVVVPAGTATLGADRSAITFGWDNEFDQQRVNVAAFEIDAHPVTNAEFLEFLDAGGYETRALWSDERRSRSRRSGSANPARGGGVECSSRSRFQVHGRCTSASRRRRRSRAGGEDGCQPRPNIIAPHSAHPTKVSANFPGDRMRRIRREATSTSRRGSPSRWGAAPPVRARGACTTLPATVGNGRPRCSRRSPASSRCRRTPSTPRISSTVSTT
jgi:hypothetical protein